MMSAPKGGRGPGKTDEARELIYRRLRKNVDEGEERRKKSKNFLDVINRRPIRDWKWLPLRDPIPRAEEARCSLEEKERWKWNEGR